MMKVGVYDAKRYDRDYLDREQGIEWRYFDFRLNSETAKLAAGLDAACIFVNDCADAGVIQALHDAGVRMIALRCAGFNNVDLNAAKRVGIAVSRVPAYSPHAVAEHTVGLLLTLNRKIHKAFNRVREHNFSLAGLVGFDLHGKRAGIIGTGRIGKIVAEILQGFGMDVGTHDPFPDVEWAGRRGIKYLSLQELLTVSDVISLHAPLTAETHHLLNQERFGMLKRGAYVINTSRGKLIDTRALIEALKEGILGGVALDVYEEEEGVFFEDLSGEVLLDDDLTRLLTFPNVLVTSHQAFFTREALSEIARVTGENLRRYFRGEGLIEGSGL